MMMMTYHVIYTLSLILVCGQSSSWVEKFQSRPGMLGLIKDQHFTESNDQPWKVRLYWTKLFVKYHVEVKKIQ